MGFFKRRKERKEEQERIAQQYYPTQQQQAPQEYQGQPVPQQRPMLPQVQQQQQYQQQHQHQQQLPPPLEVPEAIPKALKRVGAGHEVKLAPEDFRLLTEDLRPLNTVKAGLFEDTLQYVLRGKGEKILDRLAHKEGCGKVLHLGHVDSTYHEPRRYSYRDDEPPARRRFFYTTECREPLLFFRLAMVYHASAKKDAKWNAHWLYVFLKEADYHNVPVDVVSGMLRLAGEPEDTLARLVILGEVGDPNFPRHHPIGFNLGGWESYCRENLHLVRRALAGGEATNWSIIGFLVQHNNLPVIKEVMDELIRVLDEPRGSNQSKDWACRWIKRTVIVQLLEDIRTGEPEARTEALRQLVKYTGEEAQAVLRTRLEFEEDSTVRALLNELLDGMPPMKERIPMVDDEFDLTPLDEVSLVAPPSEGVRQALYRLMEAYNKDVEASSSRLLALGWPPHSDDRWTKEYMDEALDRLTDIAFYRNKEMDSFFVQPFRFQVVHRWYDGLTGFLNPYKTFNSHYMKLMDEPELELIHVLRLRVMHGVDRIEDRYRASHGAGFGLREVAAVAEAVGFDPDYIMETYLRGDGFMWEDDAVWPYFAERMASLVSKFEEPQEAHGYSPSEPYQEIRFAIWELMNRFPHVPSPMVPILFRYALGKNHKDRPMAQKALGRLDDLEERLIDLLSDKDKEKRALVAEWLSRVGTQKSRRALEELVRKERVEGVRAQLIGALYNLGVPVHELIDTGSMVKEAEGFLKKGVPKEMEWFPFDAMPQVRWDGSKEPVDPRILKWLVLRSFQLKSPSPDPVLRFTCEAMMKVDRQALGRFVLESWLAWDTRRELTDEEIEAKIGHMTGTMYNNWKRHYQTRFVDTANKQKGILAIAAATASSEVVPVIERYQKAHSSERWRQCNALSEVLSWLDDPLAIQSLLRTASRHRTKVVREEAGRHVAQLADRQGWTMDQLEDRTIPTGGFDENRQMELDFGGRGFVATVDRDLKVVIRTEEGKVLKSVPKPGKDDDADLAKEAKKALSEGKKALKAMAGRQRDRLFEAMCTQREWPFEDWDAYLNRHPILSYMCQGLVWAAYRDGELVTTFRPLEDMSLTDVEDNEVRLTAEHTVRIAHALSLPKEVAKAWSKHMKEYKIKPTLEQFGRETYTLPEGLREATEVTDFNNYVLNARIIGQTAGKQGYQRGPEKDESVFYNWVKAFPGLGLEATIQFSGCQHFMQDWDVALRDIHFNRWTDQMKSDSARVKVPLEEVPPILLSETYMLMKQIAGKAEHKPEFKSDWWG